MVSVYFIGGFAAGLIENCLTNGLFTIIFNILKLFNIKALMEFLEICIYKSADSYESYFHSNVINLSIDDLFCHYFS